MQNLNYDLIKLLHCSLDDQWRITKHYLADARKGCKGCTKLLTGIERDVGRHIKRLTKELTNHVKGGTFG